MEPLPYHTKFFDVITIPPPESTRSTPHEDKAITPLQNFNSIMCYEDAILDAIKDLRDSHNGSSITSIKKHIQAYFFHDNYPDLNEEEAEMLSLEMKWKDHLFVQALKSLVDKKYVDHSLCTKNGSTYYKLSQDYKKNRAGELRERLERLNQYKLRQQSKKKEMLRVANKKNVLCHKSIMKKGHLVESQAVAIVGGEGKSKMDLVREKQKEKRNALPHKLGLHSDSLGLREQLKIPRNKIYVKEM
mmetsp:Transcript_28554/g.42342  ORF Transcript_28554/g.42342 Transcript_28554/m.42342 type:complete len:245 (-) Transcript_28554:360-1094(-)